MGSALAQAHWPPPQAGAGSGRWPTVPGVTHLIACAQMGPIRTPGGPPNPRGRVPHQRLSRALVTPAPSRTLRCWSLPPCFRPQGRPPVPRPLPCSLAPAMSRLPLLSAPALACWCPLLFVFCVFFVCPLPPPMSPRCLLAVLALFVGGWRSRGRGGGGNLAVRPIAQARRKHGAGTWRGTCPSAGGGGLPCGSCRHPTLPAVAPPVVPPLWLARRMLPLGTVVWFLPHSRSTAYPPCRGVLGGGVRFPVPSSPMSPRHPLADLTPFLSGCGSWGWGGGGALAALPPA